MKHIWLMGMALTLALSGVGSAADAPTFSDEVVRIVQERCQTCHRPGEHAPFSLITYADVFKRRADIRDQIDWRTMPPWKPVPGFGSFLESRRLSDEERATILKWIDEGAPEGDPAKLPPPRAFPTGWTLGTPDHVLEMSAPYTVPARAGDVYRCFVVPTSFPEDRWVSKVEYAPGDKKVVHHVLAYIATGPTAASLQRPAGGAGYPCFGGPGFLPAGGLGGWAPGIGPRVQPDGVAWLLPAGATVVLQIHYNNGSPQAHTDRTRAALYFATSPVDRRHRAIPLLNRTFTIPAGEKRYEVHASYTVPPGRDLHATGITPHMHLLGREMKVTATYPDGAVRPLIYIDDWDFHWQANYTFEEPVPLPSGTRIDMVAVFDNSAGSKRQPSQPPRAVSWGEGTTDEMALVFVSITVDGERIGWRLR
jgi:mono/diheme cytochrome c family protein